MIIYHIILDVYAHRRRTDFQSTESEFNPIYSPATCLTAASLDHPHEQPFHYPDNTFHVKVGERLDFIRGGLNFG